MSSRAFATALVRALANGSRSSVPLGCRAAQLERLVAIAAEAGDAEAQVALAELYSAGEGTRADPVAALRWYRAAAEQGDAIAQQNLGDLLSRGLGAVRDLVSAYVWLSLAADQGRGWAIRRRDELSPQLTSEQRAEAEVRLVARRRSL